MLFTLYVNDIPIPCRHDELAQYADNTALVATSGTTKLLVKYLETHLIAFEFWLREWRIVIHVVKSMAVLFSPLRRRIPNPCGLKFLGWEIQWVETARYLGVTLDRGLTWKPHIDQVRRKESQRLGILSPLLNRRSSLSIRNGVLLYKQLICPMMDYACPVWRHVAPSHLKSLQVIQSKCLCSATGAPWYVSNLQLHSDLGIPYLVEHISGTAQSLYSTFPNVENPLVQQLGRYLAYSSDV